MIQPTFYFYTNLLAPYMFHRWKMISEAFPGSMVILTRKADPGRPWQYQHKEMDFPCVNFPETLSLSNHLSWSKGLRKFVRKTATLQTIHLFEDISGLNMLNVMYAAKSKLFLLINDGGFVQTTQRYSQKLRWNLIGQKCFGAITPGETGKQYTTAWGFPAEKIYNSYLSPDMENFSSYRDSEQAKKDRNEIRIGLGLNDKDILVLCNSRLLDWKRIEDLAESIPFLSEGAKNRIFLLMIGNGPYKGPLDLLQSLKHFRFKWIPAVSYEEIKKYYAASDLLVLPSEGDIWGLVINEALSMGKPVVCTDCIGASDLVKNGWNGFKVEKRNPKSFAESIEKLVLDDQLHQVMSSNARTIEKTWHSGLFINELERVVKDIYLKNSH
ncbi:MAG: glycosyltransferase family 4 protein [Bacteroidota bacterium]|nr:glycosyltransferase family 4 protein [Bacteroidota bacterium]